MPYFSEEPHVLLLQSLTRGSLKQNLVRSLRLWVWLHLLYGEQDRGQLEQQQVGCILDPFTFAEWRNQFFSDSHPIGEKVPPQHDPRCACATTIRDWLSLLAPDLDLEIWQRSLRRHDSLPNQMDRVLNQRLFGVTRRSLDEDLRMLEKLGWLKRQRHEYYRVTEFPSHPSDAPSMPQAQPLLHPDLVAISDNLAQPINGYQRFFLHVEYVIPQDATDRVDDWQALLREVWEQTPVPPIRVAFYSAKLDQTCTRILYPVCIYYVQRAPYLCAWGELPEGHSECIDWRHYRLDRIHHIQSLTWDDPSLPKSMYRAFQNNQLPIPDLIQEYMADAWGFDFYHPAATLLLRFDQDFARRYIDNSLRHETFAPVSYGEAKALALSQTTDPAVQRQALQILTRRSPRDAYYTAIYRRHDMNILLRLRSWRPHMEVLLPWDLRQQLAAEVQQEYATYWPDAEH